MFDCINLLSTPNTIFLHSYGYCTIRLLLVILSAAEVNLVLFSVVSTSEL
jgi:hypothetical protein